MVKNIGLDLIISNLFSSNLFKRAKLNALAAACGHLSGERSADLPLPRVLCAYMPHSLT